MTNEDFCLACKASFHDECQSLWDETLADDIECCCEGAFSFEGRSSKPFGEEDDKPDLEAYFEGYTGSKALEDGRVDASVPFLPKGEWLPHDGKTLAKDELIHAEDKRRRDEARRHGSIPKA